MPLYRQVVVLALSLSVSLPVAAQTNIFEASPDTLAPARSGMPAWGDYDNDGDLDLYLVGDHTSLLYQNNGGVFAEPIPFVISNSGSSGFGRRSGAAWADYDRDGDLDLAVQAVDDNGIFRNDDGTFVRIFDGLGADNDCGLQWGDYDADLDLDLLTCTGYQPNGKFHLYINHKDDFFLSSYQPSGYNDTVDWGDFDNDGDLDLLRNGSPRARPRVVINVGGDQQYGDGIILSEMGAYTITAYLEWVDIDSDGDLDVFGSTTTGNRWYPYFFMNVGPDSLNAVVANGFQAMSGPRAAWGDLDNDGDLDVAISGGVPGGSPRSFVYLNEDKNALVFRLVETLIHSGSNTPALADFDKDGDLDLVVTDGNGTVLYLNRTADSGTPNAPPSMPEGLRLTVIDLDTVELAWDRATDDYTPEVALTYNLRIGTAPGRGDVLAAMATSEGQHKIVAPGNVGFRTSIVLPDLDPDATYYWTVQAIDQGWAASAFAPEQTFASPVNTEEIDLPSALRFDGAYPNPFGAETTLTYELAEPAFVTLHLFDMLGRRVVRLYEGFRSSGQHRHKWNAQGLPMGPYFARLTAGSHVRLVTLQHIAN